MNERNRVRMAIRMGSAALLLAGVCAGIWFLLWTPKVTDFSVGGEVPAGVKKRIEFVSFAKGGGIGGVHEGWVIRDGRSPVPDPMHGIEDLRVEVIEWGKISGLVNTMVDLDRTLQGPGPVADVFEYRFIVSFEDGTRIEAWREDLNGGDDLHRFLQTAGKIREVVLEEDKKRAAMGDAGVLPDLEIKGVWFVHVPSQGKMQDGYRGWEVTGGQRGWQWKGTGVNQYSVQKIEPGPVEAGFKQVLALMKTANERERPADAGFYELKVQLGNGVGMEIEWDEGHPKRAQMEEVAQRMREKALEGNAAGK